MTTILDGSWSQYVTKLVSPPTHRELHVDVSDREVAIGILCVYFLLPVITPHKVRYTVHLLILYTYTQARVTSVG